MKNALIVGLEGKLGWELTDLLISKGYIVHGLISENSNVTLEIKKSLVIHYGNLKDGICLGRLIKEVKPVEIYNLEGDCVSTGKLLDIIRILNANIKVYQHSSGEIFGEGDIGGKTEDSKLEATSNLGISQLSGYLIAKSYRKNYGMYICNGIVFDNESTRKGEVTNIRSITQGIAEIAKHTREVITIDDLEISRDIGLTKEYVEAIWLMLQQESADDYVIATNEIYSLREFIEKAFGVIGINIQWKEINSKIVGCDSITGRVYIDVTNEKSKCGYNKILQGDPTKAKNKLGWQYKTKFEDLVEILVQADLKHVGKMSIDEVIFRQEVARKIRGI